MKFAPKSAKRIKNGIKISRIIGKWANAHNKYKKYTQKFHKIGIITLFLLHLLFSGFLRKPTSPIGAGISPYFST
jgi:hypothetical protein